MIYICVSAMSILLLLSFFFVFSKEQKKYLPLALKILALVYFTWGFVRFSLSDSFIYVINKGIYEKVYYETTNILQSVLRWGYYCSYVVFPMAAFFNSRLFKNIAIYFCLPFAIATLVYFSDFMEFFMSPLGKGFKTSEMFRQVYFGIELAIAIAFPLIIAVCQRHYFKVKDKKEWFNFLVSLPFVIMTLIPVYLPQSIIGYTTLFLKSMTLVNFIWIAIIIVEVIVLNLIFRFKSRNERYMLCVFLALALFMHYNSLTLMGFDIRRLPIQLCNMGAYFFIVALVVKSRAFFNFVFLANVMGTIIAIVVPDAYMELASFWTIHYMYEHMQVLVVPTLCMLLRIFPRLESKALRHLAIGFTCYFAFCWISGTLINVYARDELGKVNFFYIFNTDVALERLPFLRFTKEIAVTIRDFTFFPVFQITIYFAFLGLCMLLYWAVIKFYDVLDDHFELRKARIDLFEKITGKKSKAQRDYSD